MSSPKPYEIQILEPIEHLIRQIVGTSDNSFEYRLQILEAAASRLGHFSLEKYHNTFAITPVASHETLDGVGKRVVEALSKIPIHPAMALSALAREPLSSAEQRTSGAYNTDFRLALHLAELGKPALKEEAKVLDPACGSGILLVAVTLVECGADRKKASNWLANSVYAADLSPYALRGTRLALASLTDDLEAIETMWSHWIVQDSLTASAETWLKMSPDLFDLVVGNPPWEKLRLTRHEYLSAKGDLRHYGADYENEHSEDYHELRKRVGDYAQRLRSHYSLLDTGEPDLYMAFIQLFSQLVRTGGRISVLIPAGLIRSQGTERLRKLLFDEWNNVSITIMENRARFFAIDTRFKFLSLSCERGNNTSTLRGPIRLYHAHGTPAGVEIYGRARLERNSLRMLRPDLSIPEVRSNKEWRIFATMVKNGIAWSDKNSLWYPEFMREVDMSNHRSKFSRSPRTSSSLPIIEGRMVQAHRFGAKMYVSGTGRRATWAHTPRGHSEVVPQFWIEPSVLIPRVLNRIGLVRAGFCDIAGQTNERSMMAALVPQGVVCGNKVPSVVFVNDTSESRLLLWLGVVNSLPFDWMLRRVLTTTVNYFLLLGLPLPNLQPEVLPGRFIINAARELHDMNSMGSAYDHWRNAELRANIDVAVLISYGLSYQDLSLMLEDFPLLDRGQPAIFKEKSSTITRDYLLLCAARRFSMPTESLTGRVEAARTLGAVPYVPSEIVLANVNEVDVIEQ